MKQVVDNPRGETLNAVASAVGKATGRACGEVQNHVIYLGALQSRLLRYELTGGADTFPNGFVQGELELYGLPVITVNVTDYLRVI